MSAGLAVAVSALGSVGLWFCATRTRAREAAAPPSVLKQHGRKVAIALGVLQLASAIGSFGIAAGPVLVLSAWMVAGSLFVPGVNHWPPHALRISLICAAAGLVLLLASFQTA